MPYTANKDERYLEQIYDEVMEEFVRDLEIKKESLEKENFKKLKLDIKKEAYGSKLNAQCYKEKIDYEVQEIQHTVKKLEDNIAVIQDAIQYLKINRETLLKEFSEKLPK
ncbi:hypothetical protein [Clostridium sporogenes]|uniref:hypothetical protein n=1 Tax=Clostridium sporogenes TaxID=1509 RepID=UPI00071774DB|nr:hypothetical protein [Clostridium sporogenes]KRU40613.1 hypothetical protein VT94_22810 [Clostridium sporogenes]MBY7066498.1 hypothetical protein [Clostridium sporogenes]MBY7069182.1 hypothetical protein [Clostridium sporogenes]NFQ01680.1 hypothetical protein [Clostridium sporogenes]NFQ42726.1 hypothetical protein [Clostridium sporogenes]